MAAAAGGLYTFVLDKYKVDEFYGAAIIRPIILISTNVLWQGVDATLIDGALNESARGANDVSDGVRQMQSGNIRSYAGWVAFGAAVVIAFMVWKGVR
jgi:NADH-quinone oxidoreductase subunit L